MEFGVAEDYAIRFLMYLSKYPDRIIPRWEISEVMHIPKAFLAKIAQTLEVAGIIEIKRGKKGGYRLKRSPKEISLLDIIESLKGKIVLNRCVENPQICIRSSFCPVHRFWVELNESFRKALREKTLAELVKKEREIIKKLALSKKI
jgi:Rrf2 family protein